MEQGALEYRSKWLDVVLAYICELVCCAEPGSDSAKVSADLVRDTWGCSNVRLEDLHGLKGLPEDVDECIKKYVEGDLYGFFRAVAGLSPSSEGRVIQLLAETFAYCYYDQFPAVKYHSLLRAADIVGHLAEDTSLLGEKPLEKGSFLLTCFMKSLIQASDKLPPHLKLYEHYQAKISDLRRSTHELTHRTKLTNENIHDSKVDSKVVETSKGTWIPQSYSLGKVRILKVPVATDTKTSIREQISRVIQHVGVSVPEQSIVGFVGQPSKIVGRFTSRLPEDNLTVFPTELVR